jgi:hypothetical protein
MVKDLRVVFGKVDDNDTNGHAPMWKKSIFWELPYFASNALDEKLLREHARLLGFLR